MIYEWHQPLCVGVWVSYLASFWVTGCQQRLPLPPPPTSPSTSHIASRPHRVPLLYCACLLPMPLVIIKQVMTKIGAMCLVTIGTWVVIELGVQFGGYRHACGLGVGEEALCVSSRCTQHIKRSAAESRPSLLDPAPWEGLHPSIHSASSMSNALTLR